MPEAEGNATGAGQRALIELRRKVENTYTRRILASQRLLSNERYIQGINIYYSCFAAIVTVLNLIYPGRTFNTASAILTVVLAISIVYLNSQKYGHRAQQLQTNYIALQKLLFEVDAELRAGRENRIGELEDKYSELLMNSENHTPQDHRKAIRDGDRERKRKAKAGGTGPYVTHLRGSEYLAYVFWVVVSEAFKTLLCVAPVIYMALEVTGAFE